VTRHARSPVARGKVADIYPLTPLQRGLLFHTQYSPESGVYVERLGYTIEGKLDADAFQRAWQIVVDRHAVLRTAFALEGEKGPLQLVRSRVELPWISEDWRELPAEERQSRLADFVADERQKPLRLDRAPLMRLALIRLSEDTYKFFWTFHHVLLDGWSVAIVLHDVQVFYDALRRGVEPNAPPPRPFRDYVAWLMARSAPAAETFWRERLRGFDSPTPLGADRRRATGGAGEAFGSERIRVPATRTAALQAFARRHNLTLNTVVQGAWAILLSRYSRTDDVVYGTTSSGRPADLAGSESMVGLFITMLPVRARVPAGAPVLSLLTSLQQQQVEQREYEYAPLVDIQRWSDVPSATPLFESAFIFENYPVQPFSHGDEGGLAVREDVAESRTNYPLIVVVAPGEQLSLRIDYDGSRFTGPTVARMLDHLASLLDGMVRDAHRRVDDISMVTDAERQLLLVEWNDTGVPLPESPLIHRRFEAQALEAPDAIAVTFEHQQLTYRDLNARANQLARLLRTAGVGPEVLVGIFMERSLEMVVGILAVLKAGGAYLPLDPGYPGERLRFMLDDSSTTVVLTQERLLPQLPKTSAVVLDVDAEWPTLSQYSEVNIGTVVSLQNLAYVIYTSGSTGRPKGAMLAHGAIANHMNWMCREFPLHTGDAVLQKTPISFDASVWEFYAPLLAGARLVLARPQGHQDAAYLLDAVTRHGVTTLQVVPSLLRILLDRAEIDRISSLRRLFCGGEALTIELRDRFFACVDAELTNLYGPTETCIESIVWRCDRHRSGSTVPIGRPIDNTCVYLVEDSGRPTPIGVPGEVHIAGVGVGRGYMNRPDLTAERFIPRQVPGDTGARVYRTGDLACYQPDGTIEFLGRRDHQAKLRGFRIELGEIEALLNHHPQLKAAVVVVREDTQGDQRLVAYVVPHETSPDATVLRSYLKTSLPEYMVPAAFVTLDALPLTPNGKVDRRALPVPDRHAIESSYVAPRSPVEEILAGVWASVLGVRQVGAHSDFFELGGHSLLATQVGSRLRTLFGLDLPLRTLFEHPTVAALATAIEKAKPGGAVAFAPAIRPRATAGDAPLSFAQERLWFLDQLEPGGSAYVVPGAVRLTGRLQPAAFDAAYREIVRRHTGLRTVFARGEDGRPVQHVTDGTSITLNLVDLSQLVPDAVEGTVRALATRAATQPFDLAAGPLVRGTLLRLGDEAHVALFAAHHIVTDGWSMGVMVQEVVALYADFTAGHPSGVAEPALQYADYAVWQREWLEGEVMDAQLAHWKARLAGAPALLELPTDRPRPPVQRFVGASEPVGLSRETSAALVALSRREGATLFMTLLAAFQTLLARYTGQLDILVGTPIAGRTRAETERLVGLFVNTLVLRADLRDDPSFRSLLARTRETALEAYAHQDLPLERLVDKLDLARDLSRTPLFQAVFVLQNAPAAALTLAGLSLAPVAVAQETAKFDLTLTLAESSQGIQGAFEYNTDLFDAATIARMAGHFETLLQGIVADPTRRVSELPLLSTVEQHVLEALNEPARHFAPDVGLHALFEAQVERTPDAVALVHDDVQLTYRELNARANQLAHHLRARGVGPEMLVGICAERTPIAMLGILGILKASAAYLPVDPDAPTQRLAFMLEDAGAPVLLTEQRFVANLPDTVDLVCLDTEWAAIAAESDLNPADLLDPASGAYVIYTSGSSGTPKGTVIPHRNVTRLMAATNDWFAFTPDDVWTLFHSYAFDFSVWEIWGALLYGGRLVIVPYAVSRSPAEFHRLVQRERVTVLNQTPSAFRQLMRVDETQGPDTPELSLRYVIFGGEALDIGGLKRWTDRHGTEVPRLINMYGITETTVHVTYRPITAQDIETRPEASAIGERIPDLQTYLLDRAFNAVPLGVPGEIFVGGAGLARGYLHRPGLTAERFVPDPFAPGDAGARLYRTGDQARYLPDSGLEYLGRIDAQVKIRGFRIELGEVETVLASHPQVRESVVLARAGEAGEQRLVGYVVPTTGARVTVAELRAHLEQMLPRYMVPAAFVLLDELPLTSQGKVDRRALPVPDQVDSSQQRAYVPPRTVEEEALAGIWADALHVERVGIYDNFFELGGDSIRSIEILARAKQLGLTFSLQELFQHQTIDALSRLMAGRTPSPVPQSVPREPFALIAAADRARMPADAENAYPLARLQAGMLFHSQLDPDASAYNDVFSHHLRAPFDEQRLRAVLEAAVRRHPILRTSFHWSEFSEPLQIVHASAPVTLRISDLRDTLEGEQEQAFRAWFEAEKARHHEMAHAPLLRCHVHRRSDTTWQFTLSVHHAILDGWSVARLYTELFRNYLAADAGDVGLPRESPATTYADFVALEQATLQSPDARQFWLDRLADRQIAKLPRWPVPLDASTDRPFRTLAVRLAPELWDQLRDLARTTGVPLKSVLLAAHCKVQSVLAGGRDVVTGLVSNGRPEEAQGEQTLGVFLNTVPLTMTLSGGSWTDLLRATFQAERELLPFRRYPLPEIQKALGGQPLFEVAFNFTHFHVYQDLTALGDVEVLGREGFARTNLTLVVTFELAVDASGPLLILEYDGSELRDEQVERMGGYYTSTLAAMVADPHARHEAHSPLSREERDQLLVAWNDTAVEYFSGTCLHRLFEERVTSCPDRVALTLDGHQETYRALDARANRLANHLRSLGVGPEGRVGLFVERSVEMVVGILGILKAGGAYVPLDPAHPPERLAFMVSDAGLEVLVTEERLVKGLPETGAHVLSLDGESEVIAQQPEMPPAVDMSADNVAYVIYTSGSTGKPKGTPVTHRNVTRLFTATDGWFAFGPDDVWTLFHSYAFDFSVWEIWGALLYGGRLIVVPYAVSRSPEDFYQLVRQEGVTVLNQTPSAFRQLTVADEAQSLDGPELSLKYVIFGGEALDVGSLKPWVDRHGTDAPRLINMYGITETTVHVTYRPITIEDLAASRVDSPVGRPIPDLQVYVRDSDDNLLPAGVAGEIYVGGGGVARGYLDRPALTAERFVPNPYREGARLYRTGDRARYLPDGRLGFLGRIDAQVKIRGFRIELGEVETVLASHPQVREGVVLARADEVGEQRLVGYVVPTTGATVTVAELRAHLEQMLPRYMVPAAFVLLDELPLTSQGKVDRRALPAPDQVAPSHQRAYVPPRTVEEEALADIWAGALHVERVGIYDNFFELGGDSIRSIEILARAKQLGLAFSLQELFEHQTIDALSRLMAGRTPSPVPQSVPREPFALIAAADRARMPADAENAYPLARVQAGMLFHSELNPDTAVYHDIFSHHIQAPFDEQRLRAVLEAAVRRHPILRTSFHWSEFSEPLQIVHASVPIPLEVLDLRDTPEGAQEQAFHEWFEAEKARHFAVGQAPLLRWYVHRRSDSTWQFTLSFHHAILDGWSVAQMNVGLFRNYLSADAREAGPPPATSYADFVALEQATLRSPDARQFWREQLADLEYSRLPRWPGVTGTSTDHQTRVFRVQLSPEVWAGLQQLTRVTGVPLKSVLLAAHFKVQSVLTATRDVVTGLVTNGRPEELEGEQVLGVFLNSAPLRLILSGGSWTDLVRATFQAERELMPYRRYPLNEITQALGGQPLFDVLFNFTHFHVFQSLAGVGEGGVLGFKAFERTNFTLAVNFALAFDGSQLDLRLEYDDGVLHEEQVERMGAYYASTLAAMVDDPRARYEDHSPLPEVERRQLVREWNATTASYPYDQLIHRLFEDRVAQGPDSVALVSDDDELTYAELNRRSNQLAHHLRALGVGPDVLVGVCLERSIQLVVAILGVLKAGGGYVPLDPEYPKARREQILASCLAPVIVTSSSLAQEVGETESALVCLDSDAELIERRADSDPLPTSLALNLAYAMFTSGSTGQPKGVMICHQSLSNHMQWMAGEFDLTADDRYFQRTRFSFDASVWEILMPLTTGAAMILAPREAQRDAGLLIDSVARQQVTLLQLVPSMLPGAIDELESKPCPALRSVFCGGELLSCQLTEQLQHVAPVQVHNLYGPTETCIQVTSHTFTEGETTDTVPIGSPIANAQVHVLDEQRHIVPVGVAAELCIGGASLARGYLARPDQTADVFVPDPLGQTPGARLYRTGDLARWRPEGTLECLGRRDHQVKVRGFRIELGEIETILGQHPGVREAVVVAREEAPGQARLVAYTVAQAEPPTATDLRSHVKASLPDYMVPSAFVTLDVLPLTPSGKLDRRALPDPASERTESAEKFDAARNPSEELLADVWAEVLGIERVGVHEDFFELGGHSLLATQVMSRVRNMFHVYLPLRALFDAPTVAGLAGKLSAALRGGRAIDSPPITPRSRNGALPLSFAQQRLWLLDRMRPGDVSYNVSAALRLCGRLDVSALEQTFGEIVRRQEVLRVNFVDVEGIPAQVIRPAGRLVLPLVDLSSLDPAGREARAVDLVNRELVRSFDLARDSLIRLRLVRMAADEHIVLFSTHHIVSDGWSTGVIVREFSNLYVRFADGRASALEDLVVQYVDFAGWQRDWLQGEALEAQLSYWRAQLGGNPPKLALPTDRQRPEVETLRGQTLTVVLPADLTAKLKALGRLEGATLFMTLLAAFKTQLQRYTGLDDIVVGTDMANRNRQEIEGLIGFFINLLVLRTDLSGNPSFRQLLRRVREKALEAYAHQDLPFDKLVEELAPDRRLSDTPLFQVLFVLQNTPTSGLKLGGLSVHPVPLPLTTSKFDLALFVSEGDEGIAVTWQFKTDLFDASTIARMADHFERLLTSIVADPDRPIGRLRMVEEKKPERIRRPRVEAAALPDVGILTSDDG
jgi:amino acid adenylation domain-containing protein